jgi:D-sedoheptulose 7-phosphate isomerase
MENFFKEYTTSLIQAINTIDYKKLELIAKKIIEAKNNNNFIYLVGNGGSSATPSHSAGDWSKELGIKAICLTDNAAALTAFANDTSYDNVFAGQLKIFLSEGDILIGFSGSGNSPNVLNAIEFAKTLSVYTVGISGNYKQGNGGKLAEISDVAIVADTTSMEQIEDVHLIINHLLKEYIRKVA